MAAGLGFKTFATGDVLSAGDTNGYLMQGVLVFADAAARTAAVTSPQEGQTSYLKDTDVIQVYSGSAWVTKSGAASPLTTKGDLYTYTTVDARLGVGTNGQVLTADSTAGTGLAWATAASGGKTLLSTTSLSGASTTISSISGSYTDLEMVMYGVSTSGSAQIYIKPNGGTNVRWVVARAYGTTPTKDVDAISTSADFITPFAGQAALGSNTNNGFAIKINNYASTAISYKPFQFYGQGQVTSGTSSVLATTGGGAVNDAAAISSMTVAVSSGTFTGTFLIYGVK